MSNGRAGRSLHDDRRDEEALARGGAARPPRARGAVQSRMSSATRKARLSAAILRGDNVPMQSVSTAFVKLTASSQWRLLSCASGGETRVDQHLPAHHYEHP